MLRDVKRAGVRIVAGNEAAAWAVEQLPSPLRERLAKKAQRQRCIGCNENQRIEALLSIPRRPWRPDIPLDQVSDADIQRRRNSARRSSPG